MKLYPVHGILACARCVSIHFGQREGGNKYPCTCTCHKTEEADGQ